MANLTKAQLIAANPGLGLKPTMLKSEIEAAITAATKKAKSSSKPYSGER